MNSFFASATVTLLAGAVPLVPMSSPAGALVDIVAILIATVGVAITLKLYFSPDDNSQVVATMG